MKKKHFTRRRIFSILLAAALAVGCLPLLGGSDASAETLPQPNYNGTFEVYDTFFNYAPFGGGTANNPWAWTKFYSPKVYMEYSADGVNWSRSGYMQCESVSGPWAAKYRIGGLQPNTAYFTRIYYGDDKGNPISPRLTTSTIRTGMPWAPSIKKVTAKAVNVKYHRTTRPGYYYWTGYSYIWTRPVRMKYYTYNVKVTVELKKKPGTPGIFINGRWCPGNKKKYTAKFNIAYPYNMSVKNPRGRVKYTVEVKSGMDPTYGGYSPAWTKTKKLK